MKFIWLPSSSKDLLYVALSNQEAVFCITCNAQSVYQTGSILLILYRSTNQERLIVNVPPYFTFMLPCLVIDLFLNNQTDPLIIQIYSVIKLYMFRASSLPIIRSFLLYTWHW